jgi:RluA family pseudouridine synthase
VGAYADLNLHSLLKKDPRWENTSIRFVHRLDAETSGVILAAKTPEAARFLGIEFLKGRVEKKYEALVFGHLAQTEGEINYKLGYDMSSGFQTVRVRDEVAGEEALTHYRVLSAKGDTSRVELSPKSGRTHQLRAHMALLGHAIVGDKIYIDLNIFREYVMNGLNETMLRTLKTPRLALHATYLRFHHPETNEWTICESPTPNFFKEVI